MATQWLVHLSLLGACDISNTDYYKQAVTNAHIKAPHGRILNILLRPRFLSFFLKKKKLLLLWNFYYICLYVCMCMGRGQRTTYGNKFLSFHDIRVPGHTAGHGLCYKCFYTLRPCWPKTSVSRFFMYAACSGSSHLLSSHHCLIWIANRLLKWNLFEISTSDP